MKYDVISVDWNPGQTKIWKYWIEKHCPNAIIHTIPDTKPIPWCWSGGKLNCFCYDGFETDRIIYLDTDTIVTENLEPLLDREEKVMLSNIQTIQGKPFNRVLSSTRNRQNRVDFSDLYKHFRFKYDPVHFSSGMIVLNGCSSMEFYDTWKAVFEFEPYEKYFKGYWLADEVSLSLCVALDYEWDDIYLLPADIHGNILSRKIFGGREISMVIHYHKPQRLKSVGLEKWLMT